MADARHATPPLSFERHLRTPGAPRHGAKYDENGPLSPRRSRRTTKNPYSSFGSTSNNGARTPPPPPPQSSHPSPPMSPTYAGSRRSPAINRHKHAGTSKLRAPRFDSNRALMTPAKTPKQSTPPSTGIARKLDFQVADPSHAMPTPRRLKKHAPAAEYDIYGNGKTVENVQVYSDWNARVPTRDESADNPFNGLPTPSSSRGERHRKASPKPLEANMTQQEMIERVENDEGLMFNFRGKQVYRPFTDTVDPEAATSLGYKPMRRGGGRPRRLSFGVHQTNGDVDEEAVTDIEIEDDTRYVSIPSGSQTKGGSHHSNLFGQWARTRPGSRKREADVGQSNGASKKARNEL